MFFKSEIEPLRVLRRIFFYHFFVSGHKESTSRKVKFFLIGKTSTFHYVKLFDDGRSNYGPLSSNGSSFFVVYFDFSFLSLFVSLFSFLCCIFCDFLLFLSFLLPERKLRKCSNRVHWATCHIHVSLTFHDRKTAERIVVKFVDVKTLTKISPTMPINNFFCGNITKILHATIHLYLWFMNPR